MECQVEKLEHFRHILLFEFNTEAKATETARNICAVYGDNTIGESTAIKWFYHFKEDRFDISDTLRSGRSSGFDENRLSTLIHNDAHQYTRELPNVVIQTSCDIFIQWARLKNRVYGYCMLWAKTTNISWWPYVHLCLLVIDWLVENIHHSSPVSLLVTINCVFVLT